MPSLLTIGEAIECANSFAPMAGSPTGRDWQICQADQSGTKGKIYPGLIKMLEIGKAFRPLYKELESIELACENWTYDFNQPSVIALDEGRAFLDRLRANGLVPYRITSSVEGGIGICLRKGNQYADFECDNDGLITALTSDGKGQVDAFGVDPTFVGRNAAIKKINSFLLR